jgi:hypothetical protein
VAWTTDHNGALMEPSPSESRAREGEGLRAIVYRMDLRRCWN